MKRRITTFEDEQEKSPRLSISSSESNSDYFEYQKSTLEEILMMKNTIKDKLKRKEQINSKLTNAYEKL